MADAPLTINSFLSGSRTVDALTVSRNPFFNALADRESSEAFVRQNGCPVVRYSSRGGLYAVTYYCLGRRAILHTLFRQNADLSVDVLTDAGAVCEHYTTVYDLLTLVIWGPRTAPHPLVEVAPALVPLLSPVAAHRIRSTGCDEDPT